MNQTWNDVIRELYDSAYKQGAIDVLEKTKNIIKKGIIYDACRDMHYVFAQDILCLIDDKINELKGGD